MYIYTPAPHEYRLNITMTVLNYNTLTYVNFDKENIDIKLYNLIKILYNNIAFEP